ncbi:MAG: hypothetical protein RIM23_05540 [Coleofasciculus sp. G3-WIS-01]|uniref:hypothetical protein n=1 Tax=Coleofasciculus sp. G3-WIS-01 TaxID=3069528 RepID=UPI0032F73C8D
MIGKDSKVSVLPAHLGQASRFNTSDRYFKSSVRGCGGLKATTDRLSVPLLFIGGSALLLLEMSLHRLLLTSFVYGVALLCSAPQFFGGALTNIERWQRQYKLNLSALTFLFLSTVFAFDLMATPANAQFFNGAQEFMTQAFGNAGGTDITPVIEIIFNVLRGLMLIYLGVSLIRVVQAARNDEDWQTLARTPMIIMVAVVVADILTGFIVGV